MPARLPQSVDLRRCCTPVSSVLPPPPSPPRSFLRPLPLLDPPPPRRLRFLQPRHALRLSRARLIRHAFAANLSDQSEQSLEASGSVVGLFARVVGLDDQGGGFGGVVARGEEGLVQDGREEGEESRGGEAEGCFGGYSGFGVSGEW